MESSTPGLMLLAIIYDGRALRSPSVDMTKGIINRFKVMNVSRGAVLTNDVAATMPGSPVAGSVIIGIAFALGFRPPLTPSMARRDRMGAATASRPPGSGRAGIAAKTEIRGPRPSCRCSCCRS